MTRVLHVDDLRSCRAMLRARLERGPLKAEVVSAYSVRDAREQIDSARAQGLVWSLAVLDLDLGDGSGKELLKELPNVRIVFVTADPDLAPAGYPVIAKGKGWISEIERMLAK